MEEKGLKITLATIQSFLVILLAYLLSFVKETEIVNTSVIILFILHFFYFLSDDFKEIFLFCCNEKGLNNCRIRIPHENAYHVQLVLPRFP